MICDISARPVSAVAVEVEEVKDGEALYVDIRTEVRLEVSYQVGWTGQLA